MRRPNTPLEAALAWEAAEDRCLRERMKRRARKGTLRKLVRVARCLLVVFA